MYMIHGIKCDIYAIHKELIQYSTQFLFSLLFFCFFFSFALLLSINFFFKVRENCYNPPSLNPIMHKVPFHCNDVPTNNQQNIFQSQSFFYIMLILKKIRLRWKRTHPAHVVLGTKPCQ